MELCVICNNNNTPVRGTADMLKLDEKLLTGLGVESVLLSPPDEPAVAQAHGSEVTDTLARRFMKHYGIMGLRRYPHPTARTVLLKMNFVHGPQVNGRVSHHRREFFYAPTGAQDLRELSRDAVCGTGNQAAGTVSVIAAHQGQHHTVALCTTTAVSRPTSSRSDQHLKAACARQALSRPVARRSVEWGGLAAPLQRDRPGPPARSDESSTAPSEASRQASEPRVGSSYLVLPAADHAGDGHTLPQAICLSRPGVRE